MLAMKRYSKYYIQDCRARVEAGIREFRKRAGSMASKEFEHRFFNDQVLVLDYMFAHRMMGVAGKDGNPLNEVRVLCNSILLNRGKLQIDKLPWWPESAGAGMKLPAEKSVLKLKAGDDVQLTESDFMRLSAAFFSELEKRYS
jgi:hypothetical protein